MSQKLFPPYKNKTPASTPGGGSFLRRTRRVAGARSRGRRRGRPIDPPKLQRGEQNWRVTERVGLRPPESTSAGVRGVGEDALKSRCGPAEWKGLNHRQSAVRFPRGAFYERRNSRGHLFCLREGNINRDATPALFFFCGLNGLK